MRLWGITHGGFQVPKQGQKLVKDWLATLDGSQLTNVHNSLGLGLGSVATIARVCRMSCSCLFRVLVLRWGKRLLKVPWQATRCGVISGFKPFWRWKSAPYDIISGRIHLDVCWIDQIRDFYFSINDNILIKLSSLLLSFFLLLSYLLIFIWFS